MTNTIVENIVTNGVLPLIVYEQSLHIYYEGVWYTFDTAEQERLALVKPLVVKSIGKKPTAKEIDAVHAELKTEYSALESYIDRDEVFINCKDQLLVITKDGSVSTRPHDSTLGFRWKLKHNYDADATCPLFDKYLREVIGEGEAIAVLQEYLGYIFLPHNHLNLEMALWLVGSGSNGKSVLTSLLKYVFGEDNVSYLNLPELNNDEKRGMLKGKLLNITQDASNKIDPSSYKTIVSGEKLIFRELYKGSSVLKSVPKLIIATNDLPRVNTGIDAFMRRVILIPFNKVITEENRDLELSHKLKGEIEGIFNFAIKGLQRLLEQKQFTHSQMIEKAVLEYKGDLDILDDFLQDHPIEKLEVRGSDHITQNDLYRKVVEWCQQCNRKNPYYTARKLRDKLCSSHGFSPYKNNTVYGIKGRWKIRASIPAPANNTQAPHPYGCKTK